MSDHHIFLLTLTFNILYILSWVFYALAGAVYIYIVNPISVYIARMRPSHLRFFLLLPLMYIFYKFECHVKWSYTRAGYIRYMIVVISFWALTMLTGSFLE